ncbi:jg8725 [Pararge aegeria aegeria]|uniref:Jg8725 protein n=1 Tax=Pararge aegeria aegeria TaxID=348720 RepID=A0A8S4S5D3_9NEOP|nr:jg8725 [Pararge aegeria aegeria]
MNTTIYFALVVAACLCIAEGAPEGRLTRKQQRPTRGFKNVEMMTARGFGKRAEHGRMKFHPKVPLMVAYDFGKRSGNDELVGEEEEIRVTRGTFKPNANVLIARGYGKRQEPAKTEDDEILRVIRGSFKPNSNILIARGYGKRQEESKGGDDVLRVIRGSFKPNSNILIARGYGKRQESNGVYGMENFWDNLEAAQEKDGQDTDEKTLQSIPLDWFVNEMVNNPDFARSVIRKFIDLNQDGMLSSDELLRNV